MLVQALAGLAQGLDVLADAARLLLVVPHAGHGDRPPHVVVGEERLAEPALVVGDEARGGGQDVALGAVVALQPDDRGAGEVLLEAQDVVDLGAAPAVDRLVVVADAADVGRAAGQQPQPQVLGDVGVLVLVDQDVAEAALVVAPARRGCPGTAAAPRAAGRRNRPRSAPSGASGRRHRAAAPLPSAKRERLPARHLVGREAAVLPAVDAGPRAGAPASGPCPGPRSRSPA